MTSLDLFPHDQIIGVFRGFTQGSLEFHADLVLPYQNHFQNIPMHGQFVLVQLETPEEAVLGRVTALASAGRLSSLGGEEFNIRAVQERRPIPEDLREQYLKYRVDIRVLGVVRSHAQNGITFVPSHRRLPHVGSPVAFPSGEVLRHIAGHYAAGAELGHLAFGEYTYAAGSPQLAQTDWMQVHSPEVLVKFPIHSLVARRTFIFARAGFGKSNLNKLLFARLYEETPTVTKRGGRQVPVGTIIFDPDGEYFWPDDKGRPGLCDVPALEDKLVVFTPRRSPSAFYQSFVAGDIRLDIRRFKPSDVVGIVLSPDRQEQQNVRKLSGLSPSAWTELVNLIDQHGNQTPLKDMQRLLQLEKSQEAEALAARGNMTAVVRMLHDKSSQMLDKLMAALADGKLCVVDVSQMRGGQALALSGLLLRRIFERNQQEFTKAEPKTIPTIAVVEEAQSVLNERAAASEPYIAWVKEGRKYDLGAVLVTQQPGSIPTEILSQGDNWFIFHLLSSADLMSVRNANAHFSQDILSVLLNEPIPGQGVFWSSVGERAYPLSLRVLSFENMFTVRDPDYNGTARHTYAQQLKERFDQMIEQMSEMRTRLDTGELVIPIHSGDSIGASAGTEDMDDVPDVMGEIESAAIEALRTNDRLMGWIQGTHGAVWSAIQSFLIGLLPEMLDDRNEIAYQLVPKAMFAIFGPQNEKWHTVRKVWYDRERTFIKAGPAPDNKVETNGDSGVNERPQGAPGA
ncbi:MAG: DUF87 domain-containing protein [Chloroflexi bacterium]|nr:DUF87 domain-containing protein [Chloroflexota bacterium]MBP7045894.1 DUF87 domain-containing protein [Chloroflexota bacterium]